MLGFLAGLCLLDLPLGEGLLRTLCLGGDRLLCLYPCLTGDGDEEEECRRRRRLGDREEEEVVLMLRCRLLAGACC